MLGLLPAPDDGAQRALLRTRLGGEPHVFPQHLLLSLLRHHAMISKVFLPGIPLYVAGELGRIDLVVQFEVVAVLHA